MSEFLKLETEADLQRLVGEGIEESLVLDYKASAALSKDNAKVNELCKDVSAFANSAGGQIVYGIIEDGHKPQRIDDGIDGELLNREWLENVLLTRIQPRIEGLDIKPIRLESGRTAYVVTIPQAMSRAPHQANDRYFRRYNFSSVPMADYEVRDAMKRVSTPDLTCVLEMEGIPRRTIQFESPHSGQSEPFNLSCTITNHSSVPAEHVIASVYFDDTFFVQTGAWFMEKAVQKWTIDGRLMAGRTQLVTPQTFIPIFKEHPQGIGSVTCRLIRYKLVDRYQCYVGVRLYWPGGTFEKVQHLNIDRMGVAELTD